MKVHLTTDTKRLEQYVELAGVVFLVLDEQGRVVLLNRRGYEILGYPEGELQGCDWFDVCVPERSRHEERDRFRRLVENASRSDEQAEGLVRTANGDERVIAWHTSVLLDAEDEILEVVSSGDDVTDQHAAQREILELNEQLVTSAASLTQANEELEAFAYSVSHDLRSPIRAVDGFARILTEDHTDELSPEAERYLGLIQNSAGQMAELIDGLLSFSRLGRQAMSRVPLSPAQTARSVLAELQVDLAERDVDVRIDDDMPRCEADPTLLRVVFMNLLSNALKFTRDPALIEVGWVPVDDGHAYVVRDNGVGFDPQYADKLFGVFQRLHPSDRFEGTGVGLAIVQRIIHRHGGRIWAEAKAGEGATFFFTIGREGR